MYMYMMRRVSFSVMGEESFSTSSDEGCIYIYIIYTCMYKYKAGHVTRGEKKKGRMERMVLVMCLVVGLR